jgi:hypothetical protein
MKWNISAKFWPLLASSPAILQPSIFAQDSTRFQIISPFDSISLNNITAIGHPEFGSVEVTMQVFVTCYFRRRTF